MQEKSYKLNFNEMKAKVGVTDVALALGYRLDKKAGVGRYAEFVLTIGDKKADTIVVMHPNDRAKQIFFRRNGTKGDVVSLIKENITSFNVPQGREHLADRGQCDGSNGQYAHFGRTTVSA